MLIALLDPALLGVYSVKVHDTVRPRAYEEEERVLENKKRFSQVKMSRFDRALCRRTRFKIVESISCLMMIMMGIITSTVISTEVCHNHCSTEADLCANYCSTEADLKVCLLSPPPSH
jgi:hypothetical protein